MSYGCAYAMLLMICVVVPPLSVAINDKTTKRDVAINSALTICLWIPGVVHALYVFSEVGGLFNP